MNSRLPVLVVACLAGTTAACQRTPDATPGAASATLGATASATASGSAATPPPVRVATELGTVRGSVRIEGDPPRTREKLVAEIPDECAGARDYYGPAFRRAADGALADALVAVTGYRGEPPPRPPQERLTAQRCRFDRRTVALHEDQTLSIVAKDPLGYVPTLLGAALPFAPIPVPGGEPVEIKPPKVGRFELIDSAHLYIRADVFVLKYPTFAVTDTLGRFEIANVPAGTVKVNAVLPALMVTDERTVEVKAKEVVEVELTLRYDAKLHATPPSASAAGTPSAAPRPSGAPL